ncbi:hypothetical protein SAMN05216275_103422 [Streptosporangium canum]|uniref:Uncharacterized protein n=1 Tax=Streptosporangium canum TaxID=324952 RepID=A0A1I3IUV0_9ACTN|nr:hypothetical protein SAMN05216275_103422 [Streptosporangium canum]
MTRRPWTADNGPHRGAWVVTGPEDPRLRADVLTQRLPAEFGDFTVTAMSGDMTQRGRSNDSTL